MNTRSISRPDRGDRGPYLRWPGSGRDSAAAPVPAANADVVVSATKVDEDPVQIASAVSVVTGEQLRRSGARTVAEAIQDVVGVDTGNGSDNGPRMANIGMWGLKEFDALLVTVDGVPVGGPFNPSLSQIPVEDVDRIEIVKGPQGTLYGVSAFAGMIQVFTRRPSGSGGGSASHRRRLLRRQAHVSASYEHHGRPRLRDPGVAGGMMRGNGWQDRTDSVRRQARRHRREEVGRGERRRRPSPPTGTPAYFGSPLPVDAGAADPRLRAGPQLRRRRRAPRPPGLRRSPRTSRCRSRRGLKLENTLGLARDEQISGPLVHLERRRRRPPPRPALSLRPVESTLYDDVRLVGEFHARRSPPPRGRGGRSPGAGRPADGTGFDFDLVVDPQPVVPDVGGRPGRATTGPSRTGGRSSGFYVNDEWTPTPRLTVTRGARYDRDLGVAHVADAGDRHARPDTSPTDSRTDGQWSGGVSALFRILDRRRRVRSTPQRLRLGLEQLQAGRPEPLRGRVGADPPARDGPAPARSA